MNNIVTIELPCPIRVGFFSLNRKKKIGFSFDNLSAFIFRENIGGNEANLKEWVKEKGDSIFFIETLWAAANSYAQHNRIKLPISKKIFTVSISQISEEDVKKLVDAMKFSQTYGMKTLKSKKKTKKN